MKIKKKQLLILNILKQKMKCEECSASCCRRFVKFVTIHDVARITSILKIEPLQFVDLKTAEIESEYPIVMLHNKPHLLALDSKMAKNDCIFLMEIGSIKKCGIHPIRPKLCQTYPYTFDEDGLTLGLTNNLVCPRQHWPEGEEKEKYLKALRELRSEKEEYALIVEEWNKEHGEKGNFLRFLEFALERIK